MSVTVKKHLVLLGVSAFTILLWLYSTFRLIPSYDYYVTVADQTIVECESKGHNFESVQFEYKKIKGIHPGAVLLRDFQPRWWSPWDWYDILFHPRFDVQYNR